jgi:uncharacterized membrane protein YidH (DUF202 family)
MADSANERNGRKAAFDVRTFIALLLGIYGVVLVVMGLIGTSDAALARDDGMNVNLLAGIGMVVVAVLFQLWTLARPTLLPDDLGAPTEDKEDDREQADEERRSVR